VTIWTDVPDPRDDLAPCVARCEVAVEERTWRHIAENHVVPGTEPWDEWLTPPVAEQFRRLWSLGSTDEQRRDTLRVIGETIEREMKQCLNVPLGLLYDDYQAPAPNRPSRAQETWGLVMPAGAFLVVRSRSSGGEVRTCYFKGVACRVTDPGQRWRRVAESVLLAYGKLRPDGTFGPPGRLDRVEADGGLRTRIRFRTVSTWSLDGTQRRPWDSISDPWGVPPPPGPPGTVLRPRRSY